MFMDQTMRNTIVKLSTNYCNCLFRLAALSWDSVDMQLQHQREGATVCLLTEMVWSSKKTSASTGEQL